MTGVTDELDAVGSKSELNAKRDGQPDLVAEQLPGYAYYDGALFDEEMRAIFGRTWQLTRLIHRSCAIERRM